MQRPTTPSSGFGRSQETILQAERQYFIGRFRLKLKQVSAHSRQRFLDHEWVSRLVQSFAEGLDKASHPIKVLLHCDADWTEHLHHQASNVSPQSLSEFPSGIKLLVYHGQHRVEACRRLEREEEAWWYADVYFRALEYNYPAEFLAMMHAGNDAQIRLETKDVDRMLGIFQLRCMFEENCITDQTFCTNRDRLLGPDIEVRKGLLSISRDLDLLRPIAQAMNDSSLHAAFNGATWRKLAKGRFYMLAGYFVSEMEQQCKLLKGSGTEVSAKPFALQATQCSWDILARRVKRKDHPWNQLPGGAEAALARVKIRPGSFCTPMHNPQDNEWIFPQIVLLPNVLTSATVTNALQLMYELAQHLIHIIAGKDALLAYTSTKPKDDVVHPAGVIREVIKEQINGGGKIGYEHKIIFEMWKAKNTLKHELQASGLGDPVKVIATQYQHLITIFPGWWALMRLFKKKQFVTGLCLSVSRSFTSGRPEEPSADSLDGLEKDLPNGRELRSTVDPNPRNSPADGYRTQSDQKPGSGSGGSLSPKLSGHGGRATSEHSPCREPPQVDQEQTFSATKPPITRTKRARLDSTEIADTDILDLLKVDHVSGEGSGTRRLNPHITRLAHVAASFKEHDAHNLALLLEGLLASVDKGTFGEVVHGLVDRLAKLSARADKSALLKLEIEDEELDVHDMDAHGKNNDQDYQPDRDSDVAD